MFSPVRFEADELVLLPVEFLMGCRKEGGGEKRRGRVNRREGGRKGKEEEGERREGERRVEIAGRRTVRAVGDTTALQRKRGREKDRESESMKSAMLRLKG